MSVILLISLKTSNYVKIILFLALFFSVIDICAQPGSMEEPVRFTGNIKLDFSRPDGALPPVVGAHSYQVLRSVKENKELGDGLGFTFHHHPMFLND